MNLLSLALSSIRWKRGNGEPEVLYRRCGKNAVLLENWGINCEAAKNLPNASRAGDEWRVASGKWQVASGKWQVASGKWQVASGKWQVASGKWRVRRFQLPLFHPKEERGGERSIA